MSLRSIKALSSLNFFSLNLFLHNYLNMRKGQFIWLSYVLNPENRQKWLKFGKALLKEFRSYRNKPNTVITGVECWFYHLKIKIVKATLCGENRTKSLTLWSKRANLRVKSVFFIFPRTKGVNQITYFEKGFSIDNNWYINH